MPARARVPHVERMASPEELKRNWRCRHQIALAFSSPRKTRAVISHLGHARHLRRLPRELGSRARAHGSGAAEGADEAHFGAGRCSATAASSRSKLTDSFPGWTSPVRPRSPALNVSACRIVDGDLTL